MSNVFLLLRTPLIAVLLVPCFAVTEIPCCIQTLQFCRNRFTGGNGNGSERGDDGGGNGLFYFGSVSSAEEEPAGTLTVTPNPARDRLRVTWNSGVMGRVKSLRFYDIWGREVLSRAVPTGFFGEVEIDVSGLPAGRYRAIADGSDRGVTAAGAVMVVR